MTYYDLGNYSKKVSTQSDEAQLWFDRGLTWTYSYNHDQAIECFRKALEHDADCAMAHWGVAYAVGPNYNFEWWMMDSATLTNALETAFDSTQAALALVDAVTAPERALIEALDISPGRRAAAPCSATAARPPRTRPCRTPSVVAPRRVAC